MSRISVERYRVRISIKHLPEYSHGERFQNRTGTVIARNDKSTNGRPFLGPALLVEFDQPIDQDWSGSPITAFWFPPEDLEPLS